MDLDMGKYAVFVWGSYGLSFLAIAGLVFASVRTHRRRQTVLKALQAAVDSAKGER